MRLPFRGLPILLNRLPYNTASEESLRVGEIELRLRLSNSVMRNIYFGAFEKHVITLMRDILKTGDVFVDVGANIGFLSAYARSIVGPEGQVHSFEPVPEYAAAFKTAVASSGVSNVFVNPCAVGTEVGTAELNISGEANIGWNTIVPGFMKSASRTISVPVIPLSKYFIEKQIIKAGLIKIDVEGAEWLVLQGLSEAFARGIKPPIICETSPEGCRRLGITLDILFSYMTAFGYKPYRFGRCGIYRVYTGRIKLIPVDAKEIVTTEDVVWLQN